MAQQNDNPDPNGKKPDGVSDSAWRAYTEVDSSKPLSWWAAQDKYLDPSAKGYERYKSGKLDSNGNPIQGTFEHPDACPKGTLAFGQNQCLSTDDPRMKPYVGGGEETGAPQMFKGTNPLGLGLGNAWNTMPNVNKQESKPAGGTPPAPAPDMSTQPTSASPIALSMGSSMSGQTQNQGTDFKRKTIPGKLHDNSQIRYHGIFS